MVNSRKDTITHMQVIGIELELGNMVRATTSLLNCEKKTNINEFNELDTIQHLGKVNIPLSLLSSLSKSSSLSFNCSSSSYCLSSSSWGFQSTLAKGISGCHPGSP